MSTVLSGHQTWLCIDRTPKFQARTKNLTNSNFAIIDSLNAICPGFVRVFQKENYFCHTIPAIQSVLMRSFYLGFSIFIVLFFEFGCQKPSPKNAIALPFSKEKIMSLSPQALFETAKILDPPELIDSAFQTVIQNHSDREQFEILLPYLVFYDSLRGEEPSPQVFILQAKARFYLFLGKLDSSDLLYRQSLPISKNLKYLNGEAQAQYGLGMNSHYRGEYANSSKFFADAKYSYQLAGDSAGVNLVEIGEAGNFYRNKQCDLTLQTAKTAARWFAKQKDSLALANAFNLVALGFECRGALDSANFYHQNALVLRLSRNDFQGAGESMNNIAVLKMRAKKYDEAIGFYKNAIELVEKTKDKTNVSMLRSNLGRSYQYVGQFEKAAQLFTTASEELRAAGQLDAAAYNLERLAQLQSETGNFKLSLRYYLDSKALRDSFLEKQSHDFVQKLAAAQNESRLAQLAVRQKNIRLTVVISSAAVAFIALTLFFWFFRLRQKQKLLAGERKLIDLQEKEKVKDLELARLELAIGQKRLDETSSKLAEKTNLVEELTAILAQHRAFGVAASREVERSLTNLYGMQILTNDDWKIFRNQFEQTNPGIIQQIKNHFPEISDAELRLVLLLKMGIRSKEIGVMLGISTDSVSKTRHRLRRRLGLGESEKLEEFIQQID